MHVTIMLRKGVAVHEHFGAHFAVEGIRQGSSSFGVAGILVAQINVVL